MHPLIAIVLGLAAICLLVWLVDRLRSGPQSLLVVVVALVVVLIVLALMGLRVRGGSVHWSASPYSSSTCTQTG